MACGPNRFALYRRAAYFVSRIVSGVAPAELPVEHTPVELTLNLAAAEALGLAIPPHLLFQAVELIQ